MPRGRREPAGPSRPFIGPILKGKSGSVDLTRSPRRRRMTVYGQGDSSPCHRRQADCANRSLRGLLTKSKVQNEDSWVEEDQVVEPIIPRTQEGEFSQAVLSLAAAPLGLIDLVDEHPAVKRRAEAQRGPQRRRLTSVQHILDFRALAEGGSQARNAWTCRARNGWRPGGDPTPRPARECGAARLRSKPRGSGCRPRKLPGQIPRFRSAKLGTGRAPLETACRRGCNARIVRLSRSRTGTSVPPEWSDRAQAARRHAS